MLKWVLRFLLAGKDALDVCKEFGLRSRQVRLRALDGCMNLSPKVRVETQLTVRSSAELDCSVLEWGVGDMERFRPRWNKSRLALVIVAVVGDR